MGVLRFWVTWSYPLPDFAVVRCGAGSNMGMINKCSNVASSRASIEPPPVRNGNGADSHRGDNL